MQPRILIYVLVSYFVLLLIISLITGKNSSNSTFYSGNRKAPWFVISFGMLGASLSGVTFISVPGWVVTTQFTYMQMVLGYLSGYLFVALVLLPVYYKLQLPSIYSYLKDRFGTQAYKSGASFFLISRTIGASFRLYLMANVLQITIFNYYNVPFYVTVGVTIALIWLYTFRGGIKTIIWTDSLQTLLLLSALLITMFEISGTLGFSGSETFNRIINHDLSRMFVFDDLHSKQHFIKQFLSGAFITIVMTGLDQDMMQKNLSCRNLNEAKKNMLWYGAAFVPINLLFLSLGVLLVIFANTNAIPIPERTDDLFPLIATGGFLSPHLAIIFMLGLIAAAYSSADSALTSLTTSFTVDILGSDKNAYEIPKKKRMIIHLLFSILLAAIIIVFNEINNQAVISAIFMVAGYTYGPLLGIYFVGLFTKIEPQKKLIPVIMLLSPILSIGVYYASKLFLNYTFGFEILLINGLITVLGPLLSQKNSLQ